MNYICTWLCTDKNGEESIYPQTGRISSSAAHQDIYWRCVMVFYITSRRWHHDCRHLLFTNAEHIPAVDGVNTARVLRDMDVEIIHVPFGYRPPAGYYSRFQNQFYEFSILGHLAAGPYDPEDLFLLLDSDCVFLRPAEALFEEAASQGFLSFEDEVDPHYVINGLSREDMKTIYEELLGRPIPDLPSYHLGELLLCSVANIRRIYADFRKLWPRLIERYRSGALVFHEEAHTLSYLYYRAGLRASPSKTHMKRIWTNPVFYRNVEPSDVDVAIWHLPSEKTFGIARLYDHLINQNWYGLDIPDDQYRQLVQRLTSVPRLTVRRHIGYYVKSYYRALAKRCRRLLLPLVHKPKTYEDRYPAGNL